MKHAAERIDNSEIMHLSVKEYCARRAWAYQHGCVEAPFEPEYHFELDAYTLGKRDYGILKPVMTKIGSHK